MFLSDADILDAIDQQELAITPFSDDLLQPASVDLTLDDTLLVFHHDLIRIDPRDEVHMKPRNFLRETDTDGKVHRIATLRPYEFALASTREHVALGAGLVGRLEGKSSLGRMGLTSHVTAGFFDPGFQGYPTLELYNASGKPIVLVVGMKICQMSFAFLQTPSINPYGSETIGSKYQGQSRGPKPSEYWRNFK